MTPKKYKRRKYFINKEVQGKFVVKFVIVSILGTMIAIAILNYLAYRKLDTVMFSMRLPQHHGSLLETEMIYANGMTIVFIIFALIVTAEKIVKRINGPVKKLSADIERMARGSLALRIRLREKDELRNFSEELDTMRSAMRQKLTSISLLNRELRALLEEAGQQKDLQERREQIASKLVDLDRAIRQFKL